MYVLLNKTNRIYTIVFKITLLNKLLYSCIINNKKKKINQIIYTREYSLKNGKRINKKFYINVFIYFVVDCVNIFKNCNTIFEMLIF